ncbi:unnamed protein product, partial [Tetraodon nigroviridis]
MGSLLIKPVQRVMKYPLLLGELWQATPEDHPDYRPLQEALTAIKIINVNINEFRRRKDIERQHGVLCPGAAHLPTGHVHGPTEAHPEALRQTAGLLQPPGALFFLFSSSSSSSSSPSSSSTATASPSPTTDETSGPARRDYEALNAMLVEELQRFNMAAFTILNNSVVNLVTLLLRLIDMILAGSPSIHQLPAPLSNSAEVQNSIMEELNNLTFVKDNAQKLMERKVSFERQRDKKMTMPEVQHQTEEQRARLLAEHPVSRLYQLKRKCNGCQEQDLSLLEGELVALLEDTDPSGSSSRWLVHTGGKCSQGYVYSTFLKPYNPLRDSQRWGQTCRDQQPQQQQQQQQQEQPVSVDEDFDDISLFVSGSGSSSLRSFSLNTTGSSLTLSGLQGEQESPEDKEDTLENDTQQFYAVYAFQARSDQELTLQEYQHVRILQFSDLGGNKDWWLAECNGQRGYVPANYLGKMSYA